MSAVGDGIEGCGSSTIGDRPTYVYLACAVLSCVSIVNIVGGVGGVTWLKRGLTSSELIGGGICSC
jgi:hypothetical protein